MARTVSFDDGRQHMGGGRRWILTVEWNGNELQRLDRDQYRLLIQHLASRAFACGSVAEWRVAIRAGRERRVRGSVVRCARGVVGRRKHEHVYSVYWVYGGRPAAARGNALLHPDARRADQRDE